ncbi:MAG: immunity 17 family protein [Candidatus Riflebacteria bacterium]|nr:immunity 17 family protein [Candidatus Riflebacteria bacterium]
MDEIVPYFLAVAGLFPVVAAIRDWNWFFEHEKARFFVRFLGRKGARMFYALLGLAISGIGVANILDLLS